MRRPASPKRPAFIISWIAAAASSQVRAIMTPFPSASPSALITIGNCSRSQKRNASPLWLKVPASAVGMCAFRIISFAKILDDSSRAAAIVGPKMRSPSLSNKSTTPAASVSSGPTTVRSMRFSLAKRASPGRSLAVIGRFSPRAAVPAFPGAQKISLTRGDCRSFHAKACSRPPLPITRIFTGTAAASGGDCDSNRRKTSSQ